MDNKVIIGIDIEDYYGNVLGTVKFDNAIELDLNEFDVRLDNFTISGDYDSEDGIIGRLQNDVEGILGEDEIFEAHREIMDVILINGDGILGNDDEVDADIREILNLLK